MTSRHIYLYDTTLRDGAQTRGIDFSESDKRAVIADLDALGVDMIEFGFVGANPTDDALAANLPKPHHARLSAFGMTRRVSKSVAEDAALQNLISAKSPLVCVVGKTWDFQVEAALQTTLENNLTIIDESVRALVAAGKEVIFDAEHFFDGMKANAAYGLLCLQTAIDAGARWVVLCDTNGGTMPDDVATIVKQVSKQIDGERVGIHTHDDCGMGVACALAAVNAGASQVQGTLNGLGERCGNANLITIIPILTHKFGLKTTVDAERLKNLTRLSHRLDERLNRSPLANAPFVGSSAFAHKGGLHASAVVKDPRLYEHIDPQLVGNQRLMVVSNQSGKASVLERLQRLSPAIEIDDAKLDDFVALIKERQAQGYAYDYAEASFELLARQRLAKQPDFFKLQSFRVIDERHYNAKQELVTLSEAVVKVQLPNERDKRQAVAEGSGPVNALDQALRAVLMPVYPVIQHLHLVDYKVRIINSQQATAAHIRVLIESEDEQGTRWTTVGVGDNIINASYEALADSIAWLIFHRGVHQS